MIDRKRQIRCHAEKLRNLALEFRAAILAWPPEHRPVAMRAFPIGACGDASLLLATYLHDHGFEYPEYVCGVIREKSHAWLELDGLIIDITRDQFGNWDGIESFKDTVVSRDRRWHGRFEEIIRHPADLHLYDARTRAWLSKAYGCITQYLRKTNMH